MAHEKLHDAARLGLITDTTAGAARRDLDAEIGAEVRKQRRRAHLTAHQLAHRAGISQGMVSRLEHGNVSATVSTLAALADALNVRLSALFIPLEETRDASFVPANRGLAVASRAASAGQGYELLGYGIRGSVGGEPYLVTLTEGSAGFGEFRHEGVEFIYMLEGEVVYRHGHRDFRLRPGDALFFDSTAPHEPVELKTHSARFLSIIMYSQQRGD